MPDADTILQAIFALLFTGVIGGGVKLFFDYKSKLMGSIWEHRLTAYIEFVKLTALFPKYPKAKVQWHEVYSLCKAFREWYFKGHGLLLSNDIRDHYFDLQKYLIKNTKDRKNSLEVLSHSEYKAIRKKCSYIRSLMARELQSRESPIWHFFSKRQSV